VQDAALDNTNECNEDEMYEAWSQIRIAKASQTEWWYSEKDHKTYGFDRGCPDNECDNGCEKDRQGEQCTNIMGIGEWLFDYSADTYPNYTAEYSQASPEIGGLCRCILISGMRGSGLGEGW
jgi:hypothetical protein